jgi:TonB family protein
MLALVLSQVIAQAGAPAYLASCPSAPGHITQQATWIPPDNVHATNRRIRLFLDLGSDGSIRRAAIVESSGDATLDAKAIEAVQSAKFAAATENCISTSSVAPQSFNVPLISLVTPPPAGVSGAVGTIPTSAPAASIAICPAPFVQLNGMDVPAKRQTPGTVAIDVGLNAAARVTSILLAKSSGDKTTDYSATAAARTAQYQFVLPPGCAPKPTTYRLEITYR